MSVDRPPRVSPPSSTPEPPVVTRDTEPLSAVALARSEALLAGIISIAADAIISIDGSHRITLFNHGAENIFGYTEAEVVGQQLDMLLPEGARVRHRGHIHDFASGAVGARRMGERSIIAGRRKSGETFAAEASISKIEIGGDRTFTVILRDASERKRTEEKLQFLAAADKALSASLDLAETLQRVVHLAVPTLADCCTVHVAAEDGSPVLGVVAAHNAGQDATLRAENQFLPELWATLRNVELGSASRAPLLVGTFSDDWLSARGVSDACCAVVQSLGVRSLMSFPLVLHGRAFGVMTFLMTDSGRAFDGGLGTVASELAGRATQAIENGELYRLSREAVAVRDEVLAIVSHDLRNPLSVVSMCASTLSEEPLPQASTIVDLARTMHQSAEWMHVIIQDLLDVARLESGRLVMHRAPETPAALIDRAIELHRPLADEGGLALAAQVDSGLPHVAVDAARVSQVLANLIGNALKFTRPGGTIRIGAMASTVGVTVSVADTGRGIGADHLPHLFDRFWQVRRNDVTRGTGLGLAIAKGIVEAHGGTIWAESTEGIGTTMRFTLPTAKERVL